MTNIQVESEINGESNYQNFENNNRPTTAKMIKNRQNSRKDRLKTNSYITPHDGSFHTPAEKNYSPEQSMSRDRSQYVVSRHRHHKSKLNDMKQL